MRRSACLEAARQFFLRKMGSQGVQSTSLTREARPLTPHLAPSNSNIAFAKAEPAAKAVQSGNGYTPLLPLQSPLTAQDFGLELINPR